MSLGAAAKSPPLSNRGGPDSDNDDVTQDAAVFERYEKVVIDSDGELKVIPLRCGSGNSAFIDTISFTFDLDVIRKWCMHNGFTSYPFTNRDYVILWSQIAEQIFGFGISSDYAVGKGRFYDERWEMSADGILYGQSYIGGQNETLLVEINGTGCNVAKDGWEKRLYDFLKDGYRVRITRCDVAKDFFNGEISPDSAYQSWQEGSFDKRGKRPLAQRIGSDWDNPTNKGKTLNIGSKQSSVFCRIYDKAKEQGDTSGVFWTRVEGQFMGRNCIIGLDILLNPGQYWGGMFPICLTLQEVGEKTRKVGGIKKNEISIERCKEVAANQVGRSVNLMIGLGMSDSEIVEYLRNKDDELPARVRPAAHDINFAYLKWIHETYEGAIDVVFSDDFGLVMGTEDEENLSLFDS